jgi:hypothetical protein
MAAGAEACELTKPICLQLVRPVLVLTFVAGGDGMIPAVTENKAALFGRQHIQRQFVELPRRQDSKPVRRPS